MKVGEDNNLTKQGLEELSKNILNCKYLSSLNFDITYVLIYNYLYISFPLSDKADDIKLLIPKIKAVLDQNIKDKKQMVETYYAVISK